MLILTILPVLPSTFTSLVCFSKGMVSKPLELPCTPTCCLSVFLIHNATVVWLVPGRAPASTVQSLRLASSQFRLEEQGDFTPEHFPVWI